jgi:hypothetical protein
MYYGYPDVMKILPINTSKWREFFCYTPGLLDWLRACPYVLSTWLTIPREEFQEDCKEHYS